MKYLVTGIGGQLGYDVVKYLREIGVEENNIIAPTSKEMDITNEDQVNKMVYNNKPDVIIHCAAYTNVDGAENDIKNCYRVNVTGTSNLTKASKEINAKIVYISTDYVFDGNKQTPYEINDKTNPINMYGKTKLLGETVVKDNPKHFIVRTSWVFGINGNNFIKTMLKLSENHDTLTVVDDQIGSPTYTKDLANFLCDLVETEEYGTYHATNEGFISWADFAKKIFEINKKDVKVIPVTTKQYQQKSPSSTKRPMKSMLSKKSIEEHGFKKLPNWEISLKNYCNELKDEQIKSKTRERK